MQVIYIHNTCTFRVLNLYHLQINWSADYRAAKNKSTWNTLQLLENHPCRVLIGSVHLFPPPPKKKGFLASRLNSRNGPTVDVLWDSLPIISTNLHPGIWPPKTNTETENWWLFVDKFSFSMGVFSGSMLVLRGDYVIKSQYSILRLFQHTELEHTPKKPLPTGYSMWFLSYLALPGDCRTGVRYRGVL